MTGRVARIGRSSGSWLRIALTVALAASGACGDDGSAVTDAGTNPVDAMVDRDGSPARDGAVDDDASAAADASVEIDGAALLDAETPDADAPVVAELASLDVVGAVLEPAFSPAITEYSAFVPLPTTRVVVSASGPSGTVVELAGVALPPSGQVVELPVGETVVELVARVDERVRTYRLTLRRGDGVEAYLKPGTSQPAAECGAALAASGDVLVVGCARGGAEGSGTGTALVFRRATMGWSLEATLLASNAGPGDRFGSSVAIDGDTLVVGAPGEAGTLASPSTDTLTESGAVYVFRRGVGGVWMEVVRLKAPSASRLDAFGQSVAISGDRILVGAPGEDGSSRGIDGPVDEALPGAGAAYVFVRAGDASYALDAYLKAADPSETDGFGGVVALDGDDAVVSALGEDAMAGGVGADGTGAGALDSGAVYLFRRAAGSWEAGPRVKHPSPRSGDGFGTSVSLSRGRLAVGAPGDDSSGIGVGVDRNDLLGSDSGAVVVFVHAADGSWSQEAFIKSSSPTVQDRFGIAVASRGDLLVVGASTEDGGGAGLEPPRDELASSAGAAESFRRTDTGWQIDAYLKASRPGAQDRFGSEVTIGSFGVVIGAPYEDSNAVTVGGDEANDDAPNSGAVYVLR